MSNNIIFVSLGPGDPELITLKGFKMLQNANVILCPSTLNKDGEELSRSEDIVASLGIDICKVRRFHVPMSRDREATLLAYRAVADMAIEYMQNGHNVAITAEGDAGFYSSSQYIDEYILSQGVATDRISGVPAFIDCARLAHTPLVCGDNAVEVISYVDSPEALRSSMSEAKSIVLMKISQREAIIKEAITGATDHDFIYIESCGVEDKEFISTNLDEIINRKFPYFAIIIIKRRYE